MNVRLIALLAALLPFVAVHATYLVAASHSLVEWCNPYIDSCTSISATGRHPPASYLFRATMLPAAVIMMAYWWVNHAWIKELGRIHPRYRIGTNNTMLLLGVVACLGLIIYVTVLGEPGDTWARARRIGTALFFSFTYLAQLLLLHQLRCIQANVARSFVNAMLIVSVVLIALGVLTLILDAWDAQWYNSVEDAFEWVLSLLLQTNFLLGYLIWQRAGLSIAIRSHSND
jgi:hypothetical protein